MSSISVEFSPFKLFQAVGKCAEKEREDENLKKKKEVRFFKNELNFNSLTGKRKERNSENEINKIKYFLISKQSIKPAP